MFRPKTKKPLTLNAETIRNLDHVALKSVHGGAGQGTGNCTAANGATGCSPSAGACEPLSHVCASIQCTVQLCG
jgi:hypothetical protein